MIFQSQNQTSLSLSQSPSSSSTSSSSSSWQPIHVTLPHRGCVLVGIMDRLCFRQIILFHDHPISISSNRFDDLDPEEESRGRTVIASCDELDEASDLSCLSMEEAYKNEEEDKPRLTRGVMCCDNNDDDHTRSNSLSPSVGKDKRHRPRWWFSYSDTEPAKVDELQELGGLKMEEVKGFMDLSFVFEKEHLGRRMMSVIPGLQRLGLSASGDVGDDDEEGVPATEGGRIRPYLSEAWLGRLPDSPLLKLRIPFISA